MGAEMSQEEIDAMLSQMASGSDAGGASAAAPAATMDAPAQTAGGAELTQDEIDAMLTGGGAAPESAAPPPQSPPQSTAPAANAQDMQFASFQGATPGAGVHQDVGMILDVPLELTVELGRTTMYIKDILDLGPGSVVEINRLAGEPIEMLVNGKVIGKGEVVVIDERFGLRITELLNPTNESSAN